MFPCYPWGICIFPGFCGSRRGLEGRRQCGPWRVCSAPLYQRAPYYFLPWGHSSSWPSPICLWGMGQRTCLSEYKPQKSFFNAPVGSISFLSSCLGTWMKQPSLTMQFTILRLETFTQDWEFLSEIRIAKMKWCNNHNVNKMVWYMQCKTIGTMVFN